MVFGVIGILQETEWLGTLQGFYGSIERIIKEFYANLTNNLLDPKSLFFGKVYVKGHYLSFFVKDIATA